VRKVQLNPGEIRALHVGCPLCGQQKGKKCASLKNVGAGRLVARPHLARVRQAQDLLEHKARKYTPKQMRSGNVTDIGLDESGFVPHVEVTDHSLDEIVLTPTHDFLSTM